MFHCIIAPLLTCMNRMCTIETLSLAAYCQQDVEGSLLHDSVFTLGTNKMIHALYSHVNNFIKTWVFTRREGLCWAWLHLEGWCFAVESPKHLEIQTLPCFGPPHSPEVQTVQGLPPPSPVTDYCSATWSLKLIFECLSRITCNSLHRQELLSSRVFAVIHSCE